MGWVSSNLHFITFGLIPNMTTLAVRVMQGSMFEINFNPCIDPHPASEVVGLIPGQTAVPYVIERATL
jgi:hypothetical protein